MNRNKGDMIRYVTPESVQEHSEFLLFYESKVLLFSSPSHRCRCFSHISERTVHIERTSENSYFNIFTHSTSSSDAYQIQHQVLTRIKLNIKRIHLDVT